MRHLCESTSFEPIVNKVIRGAVLVRQRREIINGKCSETCQQQVNERALSIFFLVYFLPTG